MELNEALAGWTVVRVLPGEDSRVVCYMVVSRGTEKKVVPVETVPGVDHEQSRPNARVYYEFDALVQDVVAHLHSLGPRTRNPIMPVENGEKFHMGFRCRETGVCWWSPVTSVHRSRWMCIMSTKDGRESFCESLFRGDWEDCGWRNPMDRLSVVPDPLPPEGSS